MPSGSARVTQRPSGVVMAVQDGGTEALQPGDLGGQPGLGLLAPLPTGHVEVEVDPVLHRLGLGHGHEEDPLVAHRLGLVGAGWADAAPTVK